MSVVVCGFLQKKCIFCLDSCSCFQPLYTHSAYAADRGELACAPSACTRTRPGVERTQSALAATRTPVLCARVHLTYLPLHKDRQEHLCRFFGAPACRVFTDQLGRFRMRPVNFPPHIACRTTTRARPAEPRCGLPRAACWAAALVRSPACALRPRSPLQSVRINPPGPSEPAQN